MSWMDAAQVRTVLGPDLAAPVEDTTLQPAADAARAYVERHRPDLFDDATPPAYTPTADVVYGAALLAWRWYDRRRSPAGLIEASEGSSEILRHDPDIARLLGIGLAGRFVFGGAGYTSTTDVVPPEA